MGGVRACIIRCGVRGRHSTFYWQRVLCVIRNLTINQKGGRRISSISSKIFTIFSQERGDGAVRTTEPHEEGRRGERAAATLKPQRMPR